MTVYPNYKPLVDCLEKSAYDLAVLLSQSAGRKLEKANPTKFSEIAHAMSELSRVADYIALWGDGATGYPMTVGEMDSQPWMRPYD